MRSTRPDSVYPSRACRCADDRTQSSTGRFLLGGCLRRHSTSVARGCFRWRQTIVQPAVRANGDVAQVNLLFAADPEAEAGDLFPLDVENDKQRNDGAQADDHSHLRPAARIRFF